jgi:sugar O-acyltransferase (sialic acid O-acetyltransferase NeuD family)
VYDHNFKISGFTVDGDYINKDNFLDLPLVPFDEVEKVFPPTHYKMLVALGYMNTNSLRARKFEEALDKGYSLPSVIHPKAHTYPDLLAGNNTFIGANVTIHPGVTMGNNVIIRDNCFIGHNVVIEDHCFVGAGTIISGGAYIEEYCLLGVNSTIRDSIRIARAGIVGAGVTVLKDTSEKEVFIAKQGQKFPFSSDNF